MVDAKLGRKRLLELEEIPSPLILRHLASISLSVLDDMNKNSIAPPHWQTLCLPCALPSKHKELQRTSPWAIFQIGDIIRAWQISQSSIAVSHDNLNVKYYRF